MKKNIINIIDILILVIIFFLNIGIEVYVVFKGDIVE